MLKNIQELIDSKNNEINRLRELEVQLKSQQDKAEQSIQDLKNQEKEVKNQLANLDENESLFSVDVVLAEWIEFKGKYVSENLDPLLKQIVSSKADYLEAIEGFIQKAGELDNERKGLMSLLESNGIGIVELNKFNTERFRSSYQELEKCLIKDEELFSRFGRSLGL